MTIIMLIWLKSSVDLLFLGTVGKFLKETITTGGWLNTSWFMQWLVAK